MLKPTTAFSGPDGKIPTAESENRFAQKASFLPLCLAEGACRGLPGRISTILDAAMGHFSRSMRCEAAAASTALLAKSDFWRGARLSYLRHP